jgi:EmrB/QacA subfamily drug resistance transporter
MSPESRTAAIAQPLPHRQVVLAVLGVMAGMLLSALDGTIVSTALPRVVSEIGGLDKLPWVVTVYLLTSMASTPLWGAVSDRYGRRLPFQTAIGIFVVGSALCGLAQSIGELMAFRAVQGVGAGGLFALALAIVGDIVPPPDRGRYQGFFGAVFGLASVAGPLLGGWLTSGPGWRWIFFINIPVGIGSLIVTSLVLRLPIVRRGGHIDVVGATLIVAAVTSLLLYLNWAGDQYGWTAPGPLGLLAASLLLSLAFVVVEARAGSPIIPLRLFRNQVFGVGSIFSFAAGVAMFSGIVFLPVYLQAVLGMSPTMSGVAMLPAMVGIMLTGALSGQLISKTGRYRMFPIIGSAILVGAMLLLSRLAADTPYWQVGLVLFAFGAGVGFTVQTVLTAIQNAVEPSDLGAATSSATFFQRLGSAIGTAVLGAVLTGRLALHLSQQLAASPAPARAGGLGTGSVQAIHGLPEPLRDQVLLAFSRAIDDVFLAALPFVVLAFVVSLFLRESPVRVTTPGAHGHLGIHLHGFHRVPGPHTAEAAGE